MVRPTPLALVALAALAAPVRSAVVEKWYNITQTTANPDGLFERLVIGVNDTWPPPPLEATVGDTVRVHVYNGLTEATSVHHHGLFFNTTGYYDGAPSVTQCGIPPGQELTYEIDIVDQWGTYWWHSHTGDHYVDGLRAPFVIHNTVEVHTYDAEYTVVIADWYHEQHKKLIKEFLGVYNPTGAEPVPQSALVYIAQNGSYLPGFNENATMTFEAGKTYRIRVTNEGAFAMMYFWIDGHDMRVIEADGTDTEEYPVDYLTLTVAQRYSVLVTARNDTTANFRMHVNFESSMFDSFPDSLVLNYTANVEYAATSPYAEIETQEVLGPMTDDLLVPVVVEAQLGPPTKSIELGVFFDTFDNGQNRAAFNNLTYQFPEVPSLYSALSMGANATDVAIYGAQTHAFVLEKDDIVDLQVINWDGNGHPFHLHGHKFQIVRVAFDVASNDTTLNPPHTEGAVNPMRRDTVIVQAGGAVNIRFIADNPGAWIFHCHIEWHLEAGLAVVFIEAPTVAQQTMKVPQYMLDQCASQNIPYTGNAVGKNSTTDLKGQILGPYPQVLGWHTRGIGAMAGCCLTALIGMLTVVWYAFMGGQLDADDLDDEVRRQLEAKKAAGGGIFKRNIKKALARS